MSKKINFLILMLCAGIFVFAAYQLYRNYAEDKKSGRDFQELAIQVEEDQPEDSSGSSLDKYRKLHGKNPDMIGWIRISGTNINYPVMYTPDEPDYYLRKNFEKEFSWWGTPYISASCDPAAPSDNLTIYGHHIKPDKMFAQLTEYEDVSFYKKHPTVQFDTLEEEGEYRIIAAFHTTVYGSKGFRYYEFVDAADQDEFDVYVDQVKALALYDTGETAVYGDKLITLSTCAYFAQNGRMVVVAKKILGKGQEE